MHPAPALISFAALPILPALNVVSTILAVSLFVLALVSLAIEMAGVRTTLKLRFRGDIQRESLFLAQYGQLVCTIFAAWLVAAASAHTIFEYTAWRAFAIVVVPVLMTSLVCLVLKRLLGRRRPNRDNPGVFTGVDFRHDSARESFPSSHSAGAFALTVALIHVWPHAAIVFWMLAVICASLRYLLDAHFPSDVLAGSAIGIAVASAGVYWLEALLPH